MQNNGYIWITLAVILALVELWAIKSIIGSKSKADRKMLWIVLVVFVPLAGLSQRLTQRRKLSFGLLADMAI